MKRENLLLGDTGLFGVGSVPAVGARTGAILLNAGMLHNVGPYRMFVELADAIAARGCVAIRLDQSGKGESARRDVPHQDSILLDYDAVFDYLQTLGVERTILVGLCSGAADAMRIAQRRQSVCGLVLTDGFAERTMRVRIRHYAARALSSQAYRNKLAQLLRRESEEAAVVPEEAEYFLDSWPASREMHDCYTGLLERGVRIFSIFTGSWHWYYNEQGQLARYLAGSANLDLLDELHMPESNHTFFVRAHRDELVAAVTAWVTKQIEGQPTADYATTQR